MNNDKCTRRNEVDWHQEIEIKKKKILRESKNNNQLPSYIMDAQIEYNDFQ